MEVHTGKQKVWVLVGFESHYILFGKLGIQFPKKGRGVGKDFGVRVKFSLFQTFSISQPHKIKKTTAFIYFSHSHLSLSQNTNTHIHILYPYLEK